MSELAGFMSWRSFFQGRANLGLMGIAAVTAAAVLCATVARAGLTELLGSTITFAPYFPVVLAASLYAGAIAGILTTLISVIAIWWVTFPPVFGFGLLTPTQAANILLFVITSFLMIALAHKFRQLLRIADAHERQRQLLVGELAHRSKNVNAVLEAIVQQSIPDKNLASTVITRLRAVADSQDLADDTKNVPSLLRDMLVEMLAEPHGANRILLEGPAVELNGRQIRGLRLIVHEMTTNAIKYGALSQETGKISINWLLDGAYVNIIWRELDGPKVAPPTKYNFGSRLIVRTTKQLSAKFEPTFAESGYCYKIILPLNY